MDICQKIGACEEIAVLCNISIVIIYTEDCYEPQVMYLMTLIQLHMGFGPWVGDFLYFWSFSGIFYVEKVEIGTFAHIETRFVGLNHIAINYVRQGCILFDQNEKVKKKSFWDHKKWRNVCKDHQNMYLVSEYGKRRHLISSNFV